MFVGYVLGYIFKFWCGLFLRDENFVVGFFQRLKILLYFIKGCELKKVKVWLQNWRFFIFYINFFKGVLTYLEGPNNL